MSPTKNYSSIPMDEKGTKEVSKLWDAVLARDIATCKALLQGNSDLKFKINIRKNTSTLLHSLASKLTKEEGTEIVTFLLENGADPSAEDKHKNTALHIAAKEGLEGFCQIVIQFLEATGSSRKLNAKNTWGKTPLHLASKMGYHNLVEIFLDKGANPKLVDHDHLLPLHYAVEGGFIDCCKLLFPFYEGDSSLKPSVKSPVLLAAQEGWNRCLQVMSGEKVDLNRRGPKENTALHLAAQSGYLLCIKELVVMGLDINATNKYGNTPIMEATAKGYLFSVKDLAEMGAEINTKNKEDKNLLHLAARDKSGECMDFLLNQSTKKEEIRELINDQDFHGYTPLHHALKESAERNVLPLLDAGASPKLKSNHSSKTCLHLAVENNISDAVKRILQYEDIELDAELKNKETPFLLSAKLDTDDICYQLSCKGPRKNAVNMYGQTALHLCAQYGHPSVMKLLLNLGVDKFVNDENGSEALHTAAERGDVEMCRLLTKAGKMSCKVKNNSGKYPLDVAYEKGHRETFSFLVNNLPYKSFQNLPYGLRLAIRTVTHNALENGNRWAVEDVTHSGFWEAGFGASVVSKIDPANNTRTNVPCHNFRKLITLYPDLAEKVMDKCIKTDSVTKNPVYDFRIFEDNFFVPKDIKKSPFDFETWKLQPEAEDLYSDKLQWKREHPVNIMSMTASVYLLQHRLTMAWLKNKYLTYTWVPFTLVLLLQLFSGIVLMAYLWNVRTWDHVARRSNTTLEDICTKQPDIQQDTDATKAFYSLIVILFVCDMMLDGIYKVRLQVHRSGSFGARFMVLIYAVWMLAVLIPFPYCGMVRLGVKWVYLWECGLLSVLLIWGRVGNTISKLPSASVFTPVTQDFVRSFIKGISYVLSILFIFSYTFFLLFSDHEAFSTIYQAWVKSVTWMFGDLGYDDTFVEKSVYYPIFANIIFLVFLLVIGNVIVTLVKSPAIDEDEVELQRLGKFAQMVLKFDVIFECCRKTDVGAKTPNPGFVQNLKKSLFEDCYRFCRRRHVVGRKCSTSYSYMFNLQKRLLQYLLGSWLVEQTSKQKKDELRKDETNRKLDDIMAVCNQLVDITQRHDAEISRLSPRNQEQ